MLPPQTPTRTLLKNLRRQSSAWTLGDPPPSPPSLLYPAHGNETEDLSTNHDGLGDQTLEQQLDTMRIETTDKDEQIRQLQSQVEDLTKTAASQEAKDSVGKGAGGLTWGAARTLEREFEAQEMILKGLQRDNEEKTIEVESLRRQMRTISTFLDRHHGSDWEMLVFGQAAAASSIANRGDLDERPLPGLVSSPSTFTRRGLTIPRSVQQTSKTTSFSPLVKKKSPLSQPHNDLANETFCDIDASFVSAQADTTAIMSPDKDESKTPGKATEFDSGAAVQPNGASEEPASTSSQGPAKTSALEPILNTQQKSQSSPLQGLDSNQILAHLESTRMLLHSFARTNARRQEELRRLEEAARQEGEKAKRYLKKDTKGSLKGLSS